MKQMATRFYRNVLLRSFSSGASSGGIKFPRLTKEQIETNWKLAKSLVTPFGRTIVNAAQSSGAAKSESLTLKTGAMPKNHHISAAKEISASETVYVEEGEYNGVQVKFITGSEGLAAQAKSVLSSSRPFEQGLTVLLTRAEANNFKGQAFYDKSKKLVVANGVNTQLLQSVLSDL